MFSESNESIPAYQNIVNLKAKAINFEKKSSFLYIIIIYGLILSESSEPEGSRCVQISKTDSR